MLNEFAALTAESPKNIRTGKLIERWRIQLRILGLETQLNRSVFSQRYRDWKPNWTVAHSIENIETGNPTEKWRIQCKNIGNGNSIE